MPSSLLVTLFVVFLLPVIFSSMSSKFMDYNEKKEQFECGFNILSKMNSSFSTNFFLIMIVFLIFDLEITVMLPMGTSDSNFMAPFQYNLFFVVLLTLMLVLEWGVGMLEWSK